MPSYTTHVHNKHIGHATRLALLILACWKMKRNHSGYIHVPKTASPIYKFHVLELETPHAMVLLNLSMGAESAATALTDDRV
jgi:hypothetical protein